jgi:hypothetical protein
VGVAARKCGSLGAKRMVMFGERKPMMMWKRILDLPFIDIGQQRPIKMSSYHKPDAEIRPCVVPKRETSIANGSKSRCLACRITVALATRLIKVNQSRHVNKVGKMLSLSSRDWFNDDDEMGARSDLKCDEAEQCAFLTSIVDARKLEHNGIPPAALPAIAPAIAIDRCSLETYRPADPRRELSHPPAI